LFLSSWRKPLFTEEFYYRAVHDIRNWSSSAPHILLARVPPAYWST
jgi:hypothetical protein